jgi:porphobilinogen synthase
MFGQAMPGPEKFIWPIFVIEGCDKKIPIEAMPGQNRLSIDMLEEEIERVVKMGIGGVMLFGVVEDSRKGSEGGYASNPDGLVQTAIRTLRKKFPELIIFTDVCMCAYTDHGHCGILNKNGNVENDSTLELLSGMAVSHAAAGVHGVAPSAMMDGQVKAIRDALIENNFNDTILMSYSSKFASAMYGPFREAAESSPASGDRKSYQAPYDNPKSAMLESVLDEAEGADILMVKPSLFYLDIISKLRERTDLPIASYNVSGEYSMLIASAERGWGDLDAMAREATMAIARAGSDIIISYWANQYDRIFRGIK